MNRSPLSSLWVVVAALAFSGIGATARTETQLLVKVHPLSGPAESLEPEVLDFRYAPARWQTCIGLPDDPAKTVVGSDGGLYFDFGRGPAELHQFATRLLAELTAEGEPSPIQQELHSPRVPVVTTRSRRGALELRQIAWASAPPGPGSTATAPLRRDFLWFSVTNKGNAPAKAGLRLSAVTLSRLKLHTDGSRLIQEEQPDQPFCTFSRPCATPPQEKEAPERLLLASPAHVNRKWAKPNQPCSEVFQDVIVGQKGPLVFDFTAEPGRSYLAAFGLIEAWHKEPGRRSLTLHVEGQTVRELDLIREHGRNTPVVLTFPARDDNGDGRIRLGVRCAPGAEDQNSILSGLWLFPAEAAPGIGEVLSGQASRSALGFVHAGHLPGKIEPVDLAWDCGTLAPGQSWDLLVTVPQDDESRRCPPVTAPQAELDRAVELWERASLPYEVIRVPDPAVQNLLDSCVRNLYQAREIKDGRPKFQVGPTCYRGAWAADGAFILETIAYLGRAQEARQGIEAQIDQDDGPGGTDFSKKSGLRLFTLWRHAQLTGDRDWLRAMWPRVEREVNQIKEYRAMTRQEPGTPNFGLMPPGTGDGGLGGPYREYTNVYWTLAGLRAAIEAAHWMKEPVAAAAWQAEFDDYWAAFDKARRRDQQKDGQGNPFVPPVMPGEPEQLPQRGAWAFLQSVYPGRLFSADDELFRGTLGMLDANQREGLLYGTGWIADGIWNYAGSFYAHAHLWLGHGRKAAATLYAFGNHASPLLCWREEQNVRGEKEKYVGDMPHNWASAEFLRLVRHLIVLERGTELHLLEGLPQSWRKPGAEVRLSHIPTSFGEISLSLQIAPDGRSSTLQIDPPRREPPTAIVVHAEHLGCVDIPPQPVTIPASGPVTLHLGLSAP